MYILKLLCVLILIANCFGQAPLAAQASKDASSSSTQQEIEVRKGIAERTAASRSRNTIRKGFMDSEGDLWFSTNHGVLRYDGKSFTNLSAKDGLSDDQITSIMQDRSGDMWFGTPDGLCRFDGESFTHVPIPYTEKSSSWLDRVYPIANPNQVTSMLQDQSGIFWIGTNGGGAYRYDGTIFTSYLADHGRLQTDGLHHNVIPSVAEDSNGNIWFTSLTHGGVSRFDGSTMRHFTAEDGLSDDMMISAYVDKSGKVWFGSLGNRMGGLDRFDGKSFTNFHLGDGLSSANIIAIFEDSKGTIWVGSQRGSLCTFDGKRFTPFVAGQGQTFEFINFILEDAQSNIWFGGDGGQLFRYSGETLTDYSIESK
ncbi:MAG: ligand-binding sensor domain-containing protein [Planctomycetota bacterium]|jgi:ligand-binding sensor domain-containing protein